MLWYLEYVTVYRTEMHTIAENKNIDIFRYQITEIALNTIKIAIEKMAQVSKISNTLSFTELKIN